MWLSAEIVLKSYLPLELEEGMLFVNRIFLGVIEPYVELWELDYIPEDMDEFMAKHGAPVELAIIDDEGGLLASHDEIGWWDDGDEEQEDLRYISLDDINFSLRELEGYIDIEVNDDLFPVLYEDMVLLTIYENGDINTEEI